MAKARSIASRSVAQTGAIVRFQLQQACWGAETGAAAPPEVKRHNVLEAAAAVGLPRSIKAPSYQQVYMCRITGWAQGVPLASVYVST